MAKGKSPTSDRKPKDIKGLFITSFISSPHKSWTSNKIHTTKWQSAYKKVSKPKALLYFVRFILKRALIGDISKVAIRNLIAKPHNSCSSFFTGSTPKEPKRAIRSKYAKGKNPIAYTTLGETFTFILLSISNYI